MKKKLFGITMILVMMALMMGCSNPFGEEGTDDDDARALWPDELAESSWKKDEEDYTLFFSNSNRYSDNRAYASLDAKDSSDTSLYHGVLNAIDGDNYDVFNTSTNITNTITISVSGNTLTISSNYFAYNGTYTKLP
jgi:hypothetical protein